MTKSKFQTIVDVPAYNWRTGYSKKNVFLGSCFTENIGNKMSDLKYKTDINPFGILYNPISVASGLKILIEKKEFTKIDLIKHDGLWHSFFHHGRYSSPDKTEALKKINSRIQFSSEYLNDANFLFITFGTAWIYKYIETKQVVSNCHKIPAKKFERIRLSVNEIVEEYNKLLINVWKINPNLKIVFTVSPIRHWKDGAIENQRSKSILLLAIDKIINTNGSEKCAYFPSYEIVMDELRDYRFYSEDMIHLSNVAVNHIWEIFKNSLVDEEAKNTEIQIQKIKTAINHKPFNKFSVEYLNFLKKQLLNTEKLEAKFPNLNFKLEKEYFIDLIYEIEKNTSEI